MRWVLATAALVLALTTFTWCSIYASRLSARIRGALEQRHPEILADMAPSQSARWVEHFNWQNNFNVAWAALPLLSNIDDPEIARDASRLKRTIAIAVPALVILFGSVVVLQRTLANGV